MRWLTGLESFGLKEGKFGIWLSEIGWITFLGHLNYVGEWSVWALAHRVETWYERGSAALNRIGQLGKWSTAGAIIIRRAKESNTWPSFLLFPIANCMRRKISRLVPQRTVFWRWTFRHQPSTTHKKYSRNNFQKSWYHDSHAPYNFARSSSLTINHSTTWLYHVTSCRSL